MWVVSGATNSAEPPCFWESATRVASACQLGRQKKERDKAVVGHSCSRVVSLHRSHSDGLSHSPPVGTAQQALLLSHCSVAGTTLRRLSHSPLVSRLLARVSLLGRSLGIHLHRHPWRRRSQLFSAQASVAAVCPRVRGPRSPRFGGSLLAARYAERRAGRWLTLVRKFLVWRAKMDFLWASTRWTRMAHAAAAGWRRAARILLAEARALRRSQVGSLSDT